MKQMTELLETGIYETFTVEKRSTISEMLKDMGLNENTYGILLNGKKVDSNTIVNPSDELVILPNIKGG